MTDQPNLLAELEQSIASTLEANTDPETDTVDVEVGCRTGWEFRYRTHLGYAEVSDIFNRASDPELPGGQNLVEKGIGYILALCDGLLLNGQEVTGTDGKPLTVRHPELIRLLGAENEVDCVRKVWVRHVKGTRGVAEVFDEPAIANLGLALGIATRWEAPGRNPTRK